MYFEEIKRRHGSHTYVSALIRESYREKGKVKHHTLCNLSKLPASCIEGIKGLFLNKGKQGRFISQDKITVTASREYGASYAVLSVAKDIGLDKIIYSRKEEWRQNIMAMIAGRVVYQGSKLSLTNLFADTALWELCGHPEGKKPDVEENCYFPMDRLLARKEAIEKSLAEKHLKDGCLILYDLTSSYLEGEYRDSELAAFGRSRDGKKGHRQIAVGLLTDKEGCPVATDIFRGNTSDQTTVLGQVYKLTKKFGVENIIFAGDRGMLTPKRISEINEAGFKTLTALTHPQMADLLERKVVQLGLFDQYNLAEVYDPDKPAVRYILCKNPDLEKEEKEQRQRLVSLTTKNLNKLVARKKKAADKKLSAAAGAILDKYRVGKYFCWDVKDGRFSFSIDQEKIEAAESLDGCYVIRTDVDKKRLSKEEVVKGYKRLAGVEKAFRNLKTVSLEMRPIYHHHDDRIRAHIFLCMLAYYVQWHIQKRLKPLFENDAKGKNRRWSLSLVLERLKSIRIEKCHMDSISFDLKTTPDDEQRQILNLLQVAM
ncbi:MAG: IS1634 family transposase [Nanoarchaeota archaeon]|nr:IS1634 family transposase [Nanoarchaeota archaeon]